MLKIKKFRLRIKKNDLQINKKKFSRININKLRNNY